MLYAQCELRSIKETMVDVRWLPERYAVEGKTIIVKDTGIEWLVEKVHNKMDNQRVLVVRDLHKHHRKGTDI